MPAAAVRSLANRNVSSWLSRHIAPLRDLVRYPGHSGSRGVSLSNTSGSPFQTANSVTSSFRGIAMSTIENIMDSLIDNRASELKLEALADLFDRLIWIVNDNGEGVCSVRQAWLCGTDPVRVDISLLMNETFPSANRSDLEECLARVASTWPRFKNLCDETLSRWDMQFR